RPRPAIQRGTDSWTDAVQITRVPPHEISAEPVAVRTNPGSIVTGRSSSGARPWLRSRLIAAPPPPRSSPRLGELGEAGELHVLHRAERELEEAGSQRAQGLEVSRGQEAVV